MRQFVVVTFSFVGFHRWPGAPDHRAYLRERHRHRFEVRAEVEVYHGDREIETHDLLGLCKNTPACRDGVELGAKSCEMITAELIEAITKRFPGRDVRVEALEDGETGARLEYVAAGSEFSTAV